jgi:hypothetical protein
MTVIDFEGLKAELKAGKKVFVRGIILRGRVNKFADDGIVWVVNPEKYRLEPRSLTLRECYNFKTKERFPAPTLAELESLSPETEVSLPVDSGSKWWIKRKLKNIRFDVEER